MVAMEFTVFGHIPLGVWSDCLSWPFDRVTHVLHDSYTLDGFDIECVFWDPGAVPMGSVAGLYEWPVEWATIVVCEPATWIGGVGFCGTRRGSLV